MCSCSTAGAPSTRAAYLRRAVDRQWRHDPYAAEKATDELLKVSPGSAGAWWRKALLASQRSDPATAMWAIGEMLKIEPGLSTDPEVDRLLTELSTRIDAARLTLSPFEQ